MVLGGFLSGPSLYGGMRSTLAELQGSEVSVVPVQGFEWPAAISGWGWSRILRALDQVVREAVQSSGGRRITLVGHSAGGVLGRLYLSPDPFRGESFSGLERVSRLITLGSPHRNASGAPLRRWVDEQLPGAFFAPDVEYVTVAGKAVRGDRRGGLKKRMVYGLYRNLCGDGEAWGDGLVPVPSALLEGALHVVLPDVSHAPLGGRSWYGTRAVVRQWWAAGLSSDGHEGGADSGEAEGGDAG